MFAGTERIKRGVIGTGFGRGSGPIRFAEEILPLSESNDFITTTPIINYNFNLN